MFGSLLKCAILCIFIGAASIPICFTFETKPLVIWLGNALGSLFSAFVVIYIAERITNQRFKKKVSRFRIGRKVITVFDAGESNKKVAKANKLINDHGLRLFALLCPIFPGVLISTTVVYILDWDKRIYKKWMFSGVFFVSGLYVLGYWLIFIK
jgi:membrane protein DedA with SNARE-associated domain